VSAENSDYSRPPVPEMSRELAGSIAAKAESLARRFEHQAVCEMARAARPGSRHDRAGNRQGAGLVSPIDRFKAACSVTDFAKAPNTTGGYTVWSVTTIVKGGRSDIDARISQPKKLQYLPNCSPASISSQSPRPQRIAQCGIRTQDAKRRSAMTPAHPECCWQCSWEPKYQITAPTVRPGVESWPPQQPATPR